MLIQKLFITEDFLRIPIRHDETFIHHDRAQKFISCAETSIVIGSSRKAKRSKARLGCKDIEL